MEWTLASNVNSEQRDKRFLEHRGLWVEDETWLYEVEDLQGFELDEGGPGDSPTFDTLCYAPFASPASCPTPSAATLAAELPALVNMKGLLALAAVDSFSGNPDAIFSHGKNFYFADYLSGAPRLHFPWDLDAALGGGSTNADIYATQSAYSQILLAVPEFRAQYSQIMNDLVCGPLAESQLHEFVDAIEPVLSAAVAADPNSQIDGPIDEFFDERKVRFSQRIANVTSQIEGLVPCSYDCSDGVDNDGDGGTDFAGGDPGCSSASDASENALTVACDDGIDNDGDALVDFPDDPGCSGASGATELPEPGALLGLLSGGLLLAALGRRRER